MNQEFFMYRGYPLVRKGNEIYYGYMSEPFVVMMQIVHQQEVLVIAFTGSGSLVAI